MKSYEAIRLLMGRRGIKVGQFAEMLGLKQTALSGRLQRSNMGTDILNSMARPLGYKLVLVPERERLHPDWYEIEDSDGAEGTPGICAEETGAEGEDAKNSEKIKKAAEVAAVLGALLSRNPEDADRLHELLLGR